LGDQVRQPQPRASIAVDKFVNMADASIGNRAKVLPPPNDGRSERISPEKAS
jgi:hypothetical protein